MSGGDRKLLGRWGEARTAQYLEKQGWSIVAAGWQCRFGEIDLIAENGQYLAFVEVKLRKSARFAQAREFVDTLYLAQYPTALQPRFDVAEIYAPDGIATEKPKICYWENAF